jgi:hypothetical protein
MSDPYAPYAARRWVPAPHATGYSEGQYDRVKAPTFAYAAGYVAARKALGERDWQIVDRSGNVVQQ